MSESELQKRLKNYGWKSRIGFFIVILSAAVLVIYAAMENTALCFVAVAGMVAGFAIKFMSKSKAKELVAAELIPAILNGVFDAVEYDPNGHISEDDIKDTQFSFIRQSNKCSGSDHIKASYKGVGIEMSDIRLTQSYATSDSDGDLVEKTKLIFQGTWLICDFHKRLSANVRLEERGKVGKMVGIGGTKTENEEFNRHYHIISEDEHNVFYVLTPHMMEFILAMDKKADGQTYLCFEKEGRVHIAVHSKRDAFEIGKLSKASVKALKEQFEYEVNYITGIIDEMQLVDTMFDVVAGQ